MPEGCVVVEVVEGADRVQGDVDLEPPEGCAARCVEDADIGHGARDDEVLDAVDPEEVLEKCAVEAVVPGLPDHAVAGLRLELVHDPPASRPGFNVFTPDLEFNVSLIVG